jgi:glutamine amidotransferase
VIAIVDYRAGNLTSVKRALDYLGHDCMITQDASEIRHCERIVFPGVGAAGKAMRDLRELGLDDVIKEQFLQGKPILGICLGAQIVLDRSMENDAVCLGLIPGMVKRFPKFLRDARSNPLKVPHMGWNALKIVSAHPVLEGVVPEEEFYFVHSYYPEPSDPSHILALSDNGIDFPAAIGSNSLVAVQFHPEKSGRAGLRLLDNFCRWTFRF